MLFCSNMLAILRAFKTLRSAISLTCWTCASSSVHFLFILFSCFRFDALLVNSILKYSVWCELLRKTVLPRFCMRLGKLTFDFL